jgi:hypothetical protein
MPVCPRCVGTTSSRSPSRFPNDGSKEDKAYFDSQSHRPDVVLFCDIRPAPQRCVNGICVPLGEDALQTLNRGPVAPGRDPYNDSCIELVEPAESSWQQEQPRTEAEHKAEAGAVTTARLCKAGLASSKNWNFNSHV